MEKVRQLRLQQLRQEITQRKYSDFVSLVKAVMQLPQEERPKKKSWDSISEFKTQLESMKAFALERCECDKRKQDVVQVHLYGL